MSELPPADRRDPLTGCPSRQAFLCAATKAFNRARVRNNPLSVLALEIDGFEEMMVRLGVEVGHEALRTFARVLNDNVRGMDGLCRIDGEKFTIALANEGIDSAAKVAERLRSTINRKVIDLEDEAQTRVKMPISIGIATLEPLDSTIFDVLDRASRALARAKAAGHGRIETERSTRCTREELDFPAPVQLSQKGQ
jgi:diguanylate cyclase (GGDEF)-like protein